MKKSIRELILFCLGLIYMACFWSFTIPNIWDTGWPFIPIILVIVISILVIVRNLAIIIIEINDYLEDGQDA